MSRVREVVSETRNLKRSTRIGEILTYLRARREQEIVITNINIIFQGLGTGLIMFKGVQASAPVCMFAGFSMGQDDLLEALEKGWKREGKWIDDQWPSKVQKQLVEKGGVCEGEGEI